MGAFGRKLPLLSPTINAMWSSTFRKSATPLSSGLTVFLRNTGVTYASLSGMVKVNLLPPLWRGRIVLPFSSVTMMRLMT